MERLDTAWAAALGAVSAVAGAHGDLDMEEALDGEGALALWPEGMHRPMGRPMVIHIP
jgi:hypothetical protein